jgi:hypothetical protein
MKGKHTMNTQWEESKEEEEGRRTGYTMGKQAEKKKEQANEQ